MEWKSAVRSAPVTVIGGTHDAQFIVLPSQVREYTNPTLVRSRGQLSIVKIPAAGTAVVGAAGLIAWSDRNDTPPVLGETPLPFLDQDLDWIWHSYWGFSSVLGAGSTFGWSDGGPGAALDSRAMRKLGADEGVLFVVQNAGPGGAGSDVTVHYGIRCLIKE